MEIKKSDIKKWVKALRSGKYKQTNGRLERDGGFCCLGVACKVFAPDYAKVDGELKGGMPQVEYGAPKWLERIDDDFFRRTEVTSVEPGKFLTTLNDTDKLTFDEIADCLEAVYIHEVLA